MDNCRDHPEIYECGLWAYAKGCQSDPKFMLTYCYKTCTGCYKPPDDLLENLLIASQDSPVPVNASQIDFGKDK